MKKILLVGGGGHCKSVIEALRSNIIVYDEIAIVDCREKIGQQINGVNFIGEDSGLEYLYEQGYSDAFITLGSIGHAEKRIKLFDMIREIGFNIPVIRDRSSVIAEDAVIEEGVFIGKGSVINSGAHIKEGCIVNTSSIIEHDCQIGRYVHIAPGSVLCGEVIIGDNTHIGANATVIQGIRIGQNAIIGAGSVIIKDICDGVTVAGNPGKVLS